MLPFLTSLLLLLTLLFPALLTFLAGLLTFLGLLLLALVALSLILLTTLFAATASALSVGKAACTQQRRGHRDGHCCSFPIFTVHQKLPFT